MDVSTITNGVNSIEKSYNVNIPQPNTTDNNIKVPSIPTNEDQENQSGNSDVTIDKKQLDKAVNKLNKFMEDDKTHAEYSIHKELGTMMIKIIDDDSGKVILEMPPEKILDMVASMCEQAGLIDKKA